MIPHGAKAVVRASYGAHIDNFAEIVHWDGIKTPNRAIATLKGTKKNVLALLLGFCLAEKRLEKKDSIELIKRLMNENLISSNDLLVLVNGSEKRSRT